ncbi:MAG: rhomboid family intramembrane serine protease [Porphyromonas sp.]|nr:rhomboid family intramembrane serine protease [Porphyromonas sp.]
MTTPLSNFPPVTKNLVIINAITWVAMFVLSRVGWDLTYLLGLHYFPTDSFKLWQPFTYMFMHDASGFSHIFFNMFALVMFGPSLERVWGAKKFLFYYLFTGVGAGIVQQAVWYLSLTSYSEYSILLSTGYLDQFITVGASGAIFGILLAFGMLFPNVPMYIMFIPIPIKAKYMMIGYGLIELFAGIHPGAGDNVAHFAHLGGMLFGLILILIWRKKHGKEVYY